MHGMDHGVVVQLPVVVGRNQEAVVVTEVRLSTTPAKDFGFLVSMPILLDLLQKLLHAIHFLAALNLESLAIMQVTDDVVLMESYTPIGQVLVKKLLLPEYALINGSSRENIAYL
jgi:hypothetical protein